MSLLRENYVEEEEEEESDIEPCVPSRKKEEKTKTRWSK